MKIRAIITGATGMVGEGVLHECILNNDTEKILIINRRPSGILHPKVTEIIHEDFYDLASIKNIMEGYNACFFCLGVSSVGMKETKYFRLTYTLTMNFATTLLSINPDMTFCYISGAGTDSSESGKLMWARVKGNTENDLMELSFKKVYIFRPGYIQPTKGLKNTIIYYKYLMWMYPMLRKLFPKKVCTLRELGVAMIRVVTEGYDKSILEVQDIVKLAADKS